MYGAIKNTVPNKNLLSALSLLAALLPASALSADDFDPETFDPVAASIAPKQTLLKVTGTTIIDFETEANGNPLSAGDTIGGSSQPYASQGITFGFDADGRGGQGLMIFDSANPTGNDPDLGSPNETCTPPGPGEGAGGEVGEPGENCTSLNNLLIISTDGSTSDPNDHVIGGIIEIAFDDPVVFGNISMLDEAEGEIRFYDASDNLIAAKSMITKAQKQAFNFNGDNAFKEIDINQANVNRVEIDTISSLGLATFSFTKSISQPGIAIEKSDGGITVAEGASFAYTLTYENTGDLALSGVTITDTVPANTTFDTAGSTSGWSCADNASAGAVCTFTIGSLAAGATGSVTFGLTVDEISEPDPTTGECPNPPPDVTLTNTATIADDSGNTSQDSDTTPVVTACEPQQQSPSIVIVKNPPSQLVQLGETANFTISVTNNGDVDLINVAVTDPQSPGCNNTIGTLDIGDTVVYNCTHDNVRESFTNVATVTGETPDGGDVTDDDDADVSLLNLDEPGQHVTPIPTLSQWGLIFMAGLMLLLGAAGIGSRTRRY